MNIYLAGGMRPRDPGFYVWNYYHSVKESFPNWQDAVCYSLRPSHNVFDPRHSDTKVFEDYSFLDLMELRRCDLVIAYLDRENPSGMGLAAEVAFAKGLGKTVLLINEQHDNRYVRFIENFADRVFITFDEAMPVINKIRP